MEDISKVAISNNNRTAVINNREATSSNSSTDKEAMVKILDTEALPNPNRISKTNTSRGLLKEHTELPRQPPRRCQSGKLQQRPTVNNTTTMKGRGRQLGQNLQGCRKNGSREEAYDELVSDMLDEDVFCLT